ncbi:hypothetical protein M011DRAFT_440859 [Sporormia fimetaria CBS 119925]|uniref:Uncharacterized protein n=1 Tax=Sporormia fimetaria CBS 119925 TaxID=1340428 RepID=A0A6A6VHF9_9PLEO|nr:hypothetical protein M011DRAFT_440859 [Sporormia fimetaria CBS 119925]
MAYYSYDPRHPSSYADYGHPRHANYSESSDETLTAMDSVNHNDYYPPSHSEYPSYPSYDPRYASYTAPPPLPDRPSVEPRRGARWPPKPSVEDERVSLKKEVAADGEDAGTEEVTERGTVDQYPILQEVERPPTDDRRFVLVSDPGSETDSRDAARHAARERRRRSFAERGNMPHIDTNIEEPPLFTGRTPTPYSYTKPQKESTAPSAEYTRSPEPVTPSFTRAQQDQSAPSPRTIPIHIRNDSFNPSLREPKSDVFEDSDTDSSVHLRTERKPARYSFVKSDLQKEDMRTSLFDTQPASDRKADETASRSHAYRSHDGASSGSSKNATPAPPSPRSSGSSLDQGTRPHRRPRPERLDSEGRRQYPAPRSPRPLSPSHATSQRPVPSPPRSPNLSARRSDDYGSSSRPPSRGRPSRPASPLSLSGEPPRPPPHVRVPIVEADRHATYPPVNTGSTSRPPASFSRHDSMPVPTPRIDIQSPSPARRQKVESPLPYPIDERGPTVYMPAESSFQYDHNGTPSSIEPGRRSPYPGSPNTPRSPMPSPSWNRAPSAFPEAPSRYPDIGDEPQRTSRFRPAEPNVEGRPKARRTLSLDRPLPQCSRSQPTAVYDDWYTLEACPNFDICPGCYNGTFADTEFSDYFRPIRRYDARFCDFSSPWVRLAWLLTIKQQRPAPDLLYQLATIADVEAPCPKDREILNGVWYGIPDPRDGIHVANFSICPCDLRMLETLCPTIRGYLTRLPPNGYNRTSQSNICSLRTSSRRFPKYLDLLVELDEEARLSSRPPDMSRFIKLARENAFKAECAQDTPFVHKPWHFISSLPDFTVCEECYDELVWPAIQQKNPIAKLFRGNTQLVPGEDDTGNSCCLYSPRMRRVWERACEEADYEYLRRKAVERKRAERKKLRDTKELEQWLRSMEVGGTYREADLERIRRDIRGVEREWRAVE